MLFLMVLFILTCCHVVLFKPASDCIFECTGEFCAIGVFQKYPINDEVIHGKVKSLAWNSLEYTVKESVCGCLESGLYFIFYLI